MCILGDKMDPLENNYDCDAEYRSNLKIAFNFIYWAQIQFLFNVSN